MKEFKRKRHLTPQQINEIIDLWFGQNMPSKEIAKLYPINFNHVQRVVKKYAPPGTCMRSFRNRYRKLTDYLAKRILIENRRGATYKELGLKYHVSAWAIREVCVGHNFKHVWRRFREKYGVNDAIISVV